MTKNSPKREWWLKKRNSTLKKYKKLEQLAAYYTKLLKDGFSKDGVENICDIYLQQHPIKMHIQSYTNTMNHYFTFTLDYHTKSMK
jgi:hypothetical protein